MTFKLEGSSIKIRLYKSLKIVRTKRPGIVVITAIRSASLSSKCGDSITRNTDEEKSHEGSSELEGGASTMILLPFHPVILTAVAVFLINMLILHGHRHRIMNGMLSLSTSVSSKQARWNRFRCCPGCFKLTGTCNTKHLRSG